MCECNPPVSFFFVMNIPGPKNHGHGIVNIRAGHLNTNCAGDDFSALFSTGVWGGGCSGCSYRLNEESEDSHLSASCYQ